MGQQTGVGHLAQRLAQGVAQTLTIDLQGFARRFGRGPQRDGGQALPLAARHIAQGIGNIAQPHHGLAHHGGLAHAQTPGVPRAGHHGLRGRHPKVRTRGGFHGRGAGGQGNGRQRQDG